MKTRFLLFYFACLTLGAVAQELEIRRAEPVTPLASPLPQEQPAGINEASRFIAGLPPTTPGLLADWAQTSEWSLSSRSISRNWQAFEKFHLDPIRVWRAANLPDLNPDTVFYPFSGPDIVHAQTLFPNATTYILCGLEPTGTIPTIQSILPLRPTLNWMQVSVKTLIVAGYFVTKDMEVDLKQSPLQGTMPVLCLMLARNGDRIVSVKSDANRAEIRFLTPGDSRVRTLYYFSINLRNDGLRKGNAFLEFIRASHPDVGYLKSASYLLHESDFSTIRDTLLTQCRTILQDDSGIPLRSFNPDNWRIRNFGVYAAPLDIFKKYEQPDMAEFYAKSPSTPLPFGVGYHWDPKTANLMEFTATGTR